MSNTSIFTPIRGTEEKIDMIAFTNGNIYFATDTQKIYMDYLDDNGTQNRIEYASNSGGSGNSGIYYAKYTPTDADKLETEILIPIDAIEGGEYPAVDDLVINVTEGSLYRVEAINRLNSCIQCLRLTISGSGSGTSTLEDSIDITIEDLENSYLINGQDAYIYFTANAAKKANGNLKDNTLTVKWIMYYTEDNENYIQYQSGTIQDVKSGERTQFNIGTYARESSNCRITLIASEANNDGETATYSKNFSTSDLTLSYLSSFSNITAISVDKAKIECKIVGKMAKQVEYYFDDMDTPFLTKTFTETQSEIEDIVVLSQYNNINVTHGYHTIMVRLFQVVNEVKGLEATPLKYELATKVETDKNTIIWLGDYQSTYYSYDVIQIPFRVYDPQNSSSVEVHFKKNNVELDSSPQTITDATKFSYFEISDAEMNVDNVYTISCGDGDYESIRTVEFTIVEDTTRSTFVVQQSSSLAYNLNTIGSGRSNNESEQKRETLINNNIAAKFENFNWYNNGWIKDKNNKTCLRISNGAKLTIPLGKMIFGSTSSEKDSTTDVSHTLEVCFKIRNVQDYNNLIKNVTRYQNDSQFFFDFYGYTYTLASSFVEGTTYYEKDSSNNYTYNSVTIDASGFEVDKYYTRSESEGYKTDYTNYDSYLTHFLKSEENKTGISYDDLTFDYIQKQTNLNNVVCGYYSGDAASVTGLCLGPQDAFFSNGTDTVNISYVEDEMLTLSVIYSDTNKLMFMYLNGILTGVIKSSQSNGFSIDSQNMVFNSSNCDIDLYKVRIYNTDLDVNNIVINYAIDTQNVDIYDQNNQLTYPNDKIKEYQLVYNNSSAGTGIIQYNNNHPSSPLMPYIIFDTTNSNSDDKLSYSKQNNIPISVEFVNTPLERAYVAGQLEQLAYDDGLWVDGDSAEKKAEAVQTYYQHHCPSWIGDYINMGVQGTSSEFYPRRNYKLKTKTSLEYIEDTDTIKSNAEYNSKLEENGYSKSLPDKVYKDYVHIFLNRGPFKELYEKDMAGLKADKYVLSETLLAQDGVTYYSDSNGKNKVEFSDEEGGIKYKRNTYYIKNEDYIAYGKEKTRQKYFYFNNYTAGTTKFTMKVDYMESSGTYNMGFANMVKNAYTKHPLSDYNGNAFVIGQTGSITQITPTEYEPSVTYYYYNHKGNIDGKYVNAEDDGLRMYTAEEIETIKPGYSYDEQLAAFLKGPYYLAILQGVKKVLGGDGSTALTSETSEADRKSNFDSTNKNTDITLDSCFNKWYNVTASTLEPYSVEKTDDYRTSVGGFRVMAFHKKSDGSYQYIGLYNMLIDKGADECFGFKPNKTTGDTILQHYANDQEIADMAECWEFENNNRTFCSYRDPLNRKELSFDVIKDGKRQLNAKDSAPIVADSFEYRYNANADILDYIVDPTTNSGKLSSEDAVKYMNENNVDFTFYSDNITEGQDARCDFFFNATKNWEKAVKWVWSTCTDSVAAQGEYKEAEVYEAVYVPNTYYTYVIDEENSENNAYVISTGDFNKKENYYKLVSTNTYEGCKLIDSSKADKIYSANTYYILSGGSYVLCTESDFNASYVYYTLNNYTDEQLAGMADRLVVKATTYDSNELYYDYDGTSICNDKAPSAVTNGRYLLESDFNTYKDNLYVGTTVTYSGKEYKYDTKEYRLAKFFNELPKHFDIEYMATYFIMTEVFECYDSRGKNCMMASWGPKTEGGDYIWYPIFYDIDTQLGINNTGIPSFEYNVDATEDGNFSTSDSVLWNNFYKLFKNIAIIPKYRQLKGLSTGVDTTWWSGALSNPPLKSVDNIEAWYNTDYSVTKNFADKGVRPIIVKDLDEYYKYITITNSLSYLDGVTGHLSTNDKGEYAVDYNGTYFYALQGDRSLSRRQFLTNRLEYIDSWLNEGDYKRGGNNRIRGRIAANNSAKTSDTWVETTSESYFTDAEFGQEGSTKRHMFDAEYWVTLTPTHSSYVTLGDDNEAYPSEKYDGITPLKFNIDAIETGVRQSSGYPEQLLYIYGMNNMKDVGDLSKLYWQEFYIEGNASKLTSLKLGYDGLDADGNRWHNDKVNPPSIPASSESTGMPLLKEVNMSNMQITGDSLALDLTSCEKLENFRATGSNFVDIKFADGVALNTVYLPATITTLKLVEARMLKNLITSYTYPVLDTVNNKLKAEPGLYIEGLFDDKGAVAISTVDIEGGSLGYDSYKLLNKYFTIRKSKTTNKTAIKMTKVDWCPYDVLVEGDDLDDTSLSEDTTLYYEDDGHYTLNKYVKNVLNVEDKISNGLIYKLDTSIKSETINQIKDITMLEYLMNNTNQFIKEANSSKCPEITGIIYVNNDEYTQVASGSEYNSERNKYYIKSGETYDDYVYSADTWSSDVATGNIYYCIKEVYVRNTIQPNFPDLTFFFAHIYKAYTARFLVMAADSGETGSYTLLGSQTIDGVTATWFNEPTYTQAVIALAKPNYDLVGWATKNDVEAERIIDLETSTNNWSSQSLVADQYTYNFYAVCELHKWTIQYYYQGENGQTATPFSTEKVKHGAHPGGPEVAPYKDDTGLAYDETYLLNGYSKSTNGTDIIDFSTTTVTEDLKYYAAYSTEIIKVSDSRNIHNEYFEIAENESYVDTSDSQYDISDGCCLALKTQIRGKIAIPAEFNGKKVISINETFNKDYNGEKITHVFFQKPTDSAIANIRTIRQRTFSGNTNLQYCEFPKGLRIIGSAVGNYIKKANTTNGIDSIWDSTYNENGKIVYERHSGAFWNCTSLSNFNMGDSTILEIYPYTFWCAGSSNYGGVVILSPETKTVGYRGMMNIRNLSRVEIGATGKGSVFKMIGTTSSPQVSFGYLSTYWSDDPIDSTWTEDDFPTAVTFTYYGTTYTVDTLPKAVLDGTASSKPVYTYEVLT